MSRDDGPLVVQGPGNVLLGDDGIGVPVVEPLLVLAAELHGMDAMAAAGRPRLAAELAGASA